MGLGMAAKTSGRLAKSSAAAFSVLSAACYLWEYGRQDLCGLRGCGQGEGTLSHLGLPGCCWVGLQWDSCAESHPHARVLCIVCSFQFFLFGEPVLW